MIGDAQLPVVLLNCLACWRFALPMSAAITSRVWRYPMLRICVHISGDGVVCFGSVWGLRSLKSSIAHTGGDFQISCGGFPAASAVCTLFFGRGICSLEQGDIKLSAYIEDFIPFGLQRVYRFLMVVASKTPGVVSFATPQFWLL